MSTLLTTIIVGQQLLCLVVLMLVLSSSETRRYPGLSVFSLMSWLLSLLLVAIWFNMSFFMAISRGQEVMLRSTESTGMAFNGRERSQICLPMVRHSPLWPNIVGSQPLRSSRVV